MMMNRRPYFPEKNAEAMGLCQTVDEIRPGWFHERLIDKETGEVERAFIYAECKGKAMLMSDGEDETMMLADFFAKYDSGEIR